MNYSDRTQRFNEATRRHTPEELAEISKKRRAFEDYKRYENKAADIRNEWERLKRDPPPLYQNIIRRYEELADKAYVTATGKPRYVPPPAAPTSTAPQPVARPVGDGRVPWQGNAASAPQPYTKPVGKGVWASPGINTSIQPQQTYSPTFMRQAGNMTMANSVPAMGDVRKIANCPGVSLASPTIQAGMGAGVGSMLSQGAANYALGQQQMGWANSQNNLAGQQARNQEALGWGNIQARNTQNASANQNAMQGNLYQFLRQMYGGL